ncbi:hypothetical protein L6164_023458 [Bauhinia variegata]|uniref:Uncharacterized protein n=1 Tax=Bauhinia variegata TaxID=167791 RepID=A0ACB9MK71_BAUVA|nr:hypothetical protein L6164_023458 [Bauhinia variegata]
MDITAEDFSFLLTTNLESAYHISQLVHPLLKDSGAASIVLISSIAGVTSIKNIASIYSAAKGAINQLTRNLAREWAKDNIRINCVAPGSIKTPLTGRVIVTDRAGHAYDVMSSISNKELNSYDGVVAVELKNLRPQLYSAAEYCEKSYLHSEQKQMVLDNLKDYAVRALVNAVDHLGTVAYKLTDLVEQQTSDVSTIDLKVSTLNQQYLTCQIYTDKEGLRQEQLLAFVPRHHKHYILPSKMNCYFVHLEENIGAIDL